MSATSRAAAMRGARQPTVAAPAVPSMPKRVAPDKCDCLVHCGDDPWLKDGRAYPCPSKVRRDRECAEAAERFDLQRRIADDAAAAKVTVESRLAETPTGLWLDMSEAPPAAADCARYLLLRRLAEQHPDQPQLLRLGTPPAAPCRNNQRTTTP